METLTLKEALSLENIKRAIEESNEDMLKLINK
jgi:hypothetical protein